MRLPAFSTRKHKLFLVKNKKPWILANANLFLSRFRVIFWFKTYQQFEATVTHHVQVSNLGFDNEIKRNLLMSVSQYSSYGLIILALDATFSTYSFSQQLAS